MRLIAIEKSAHTVAAGIPAMILVSTGSYGIDDGPMLVQNVSQCRGPVYAQCKWMLSEIFADPTIDWTAVILAGEIPRSKLDPIREVFKMYARVLEDAGLRIDVAWCNVETLIPGGWDRWENGVAVPSLLTPILLDPARRAKLPESLRFIDAASEPVSCTKREGAFGDPAGFQNAQREVYTYFGEIIDAAIYYVTKDARINGTFGNVVNSPGAYPPFDLNGWAQADRMWPASPQCYLMSGEGAGIRNGVTGRHPKWLAFLVGIMQMQVNHGSYPVCTDLSYQSVTKWHMERWFMAASACGAKVSPYWTGGGEFQTAEGCRQLLAASKVKGPKTLPPVTLETVDLPGICTMDEFVSRLTA
jgi:hypothetical protein